MHAAAARTTYAYGQEVGAPSYGLGAWGSWLLGYPDQALRMGNEALAITDRIPHGFTYSRGPYWISVLRAYRREWPLVEARTVAAIASTQQHRLAMVVAVGNIIRAPAKAMLDPRDEFLAGTAALAAYRAIGARFQITYQLVLLAQVLAARGWHGEGPFCFAQGGVSRGNR
jgi:hypothetical protein